MKGAEFCWSCGTTRFGNGPDCAACGTPVVGPSMQDDEVTGLSFGVRSGLRSTTGLAVSVDDGVATLVTTSGEVKHVPVAKLKPTANLENGLGLGKGHSIGGVSNLEAGPRRLVGADEPRLRRSASCNARAAASFRLGGAGAPRWCGDRQLSVVHDGAGVAPDVARAQRRETKRCDLQRRRVAQGGVSGQA